MTFSLILQRPRTELLFDAHQQNRRNAAMPDRVRQALHRHDWTCNVCGVRLPGLMKIDHLDGHGPGGRIAPICQLCHDLKHPLWAAAEHRLAPVALQEMDQRTLTRLCWIMLSRSLHEERGKERLRPIIRVLAQRRIQAERALRTTHMTEAFEGLFTVLDFVGAESANGIAWRLDDCVRLMPAAVLDSSTLCAWTGADVVPASRPVLREATRQPLPLGEADALLAAAKSLAAQGCDVRTEPLLKSACDFVRTSRQPPWAAGGPRTERATPPAAARSRSLGQRPARRTLRASEGPSETPSRRAAPPRRAQDPQDPPQPKVSRRPHPARDPVNGDAEMS